jgi:FAD/FMN-containing dehydrogenase
MPDLGSFVEALGDMPIERDAAAVRQKSRDMTLMFSPVMKRELEDRTADLVVQPRSKADVLKAAAAAARFRVPLLARGGGTCNFGQGIPLKGGAIVDMTALDRVVWVKGARVRAETGVRLIDIDGVTRPQGWELRMHSSTKRVATIGGFVGGGHAGVGSCVYGILRDRGNILGLEVVSVEESPQVVEVRGGDVNLVHHAYGSNGLITEVEMPLAPAWPWVEAIVTFAEFMGAVRFAHALATADGIVKKLISISGWPLPSMMRPLAGLVPDGRHMVLCMVAEPFFESFAALVADTDGTIVSQCGEGAGSYGLPLYEFSWGHARFHVNRVDRSINSVVGLFPPDDLLGSIERCYKRFKGVGPLHLEVKRFDSALAFQGSPYFQHRDDADLSAVIAGLEAEGVRVANNHTFLVREGGMKSIGEADRAFKRRMDPFDLLNPGKMSFAAEEKSESVGAALATSGWTYRDVGAAKGSAAAE